MVHSEPNIEPMSWVPTVSVHEVSFGKYAKPTSLVKTKVNYLGFLVGTNGVQPLPKKVTAIEAPEPPKDIDELHQFFGLVGFYRKLTPFFTNLTTCFNTMLRKGAVFKGTEQCGNAFKLLKSELVKMPTLQYPRYVCVDFSFCCFAINPIVFFFETECY